MVACFLFQEGGDLHIKNHQGLSPMHLCPQDIGTVISTFVQNYGYVVSPFCVLTYGEGLGKNTTEMLV